MSDRTTKEPKIVGLLSKEREELSITADRTYIQLLPGSVREDGDWKATGTEPFRVMLSQSGTRVFLSALDIAGLLKLIEENKKDIDAGIAIARERYRAKQERMEQVLGD